MAENHAKNPVDMTAAAKIAYHKHVRTQMAVAKALYDSKNVNLTITVLEGLLETTYCSLIVRLKSQILLALSHELWAFTEKHRLLAESLWNRIRDIEPVGEDQFIETTLEETRQTLDKLRTLQEEKQPLDDEYDPDDTEGPSTAPEETLLELGRGVVRGHIQALEAEVPFRPGQAAMKLSAMYQGVAVHTTPEYNKAVESGDMEAADSFFWEMLKRAFLEGEATAKRRVKQVSSLLLFLVADADTWQSLQRRQAKGSPNLHKLRNLRAARRNVPSVNGSLKKPVKLRLSLGIPVHGTPRLPTRYPNHQAPTCPLPLGAALRVQPHAVQPPLAQTTMP